jgi:hypothetical protein
MARAREIVEVLGIRAAPLPSNALKCAAAPLGKSISKAMRTVVNKLPADLKYVVRRSIWINFSMSNIYQAPIVNVYMFTSYVCNVCLGDHKSVESSAAHVGSRDELAKQIHCEL